MYGKTGLYIFQMALPRVNTRVLLLLLLFPPLTDGPTQAIAFFFKNYGEFNKTMQGHLIVTEGRRYPLVILSGSKVGYC